MKKKVLIIMSLIAFISIPLLKSCKGDDGETTTDPLVSQPDLQVVTPTNKEMYDVGDKIEIEFTVNKEKKLGDIEMFVDDTLYSVLDWDNGTVVLDTKNSRVGEIRIQFAYNDEQGVGRSDTRTVILFSDSQPEYKTASIVKEYPHERTSYTQGLEFYNGFLFEGTGQRGSSILAEVDLNTGQIQRKKELDAGFFGEGISILNDTIYQLTYTSSICKVYDIAFNELNEFTYTGQGWGMCNNGSQLIMSNGSSEIVWRDPRTFQITKRLQIFDHTKEYVNLNELELIEGNLYANIYTENQIVEIDTATGKVLSTIDCSSLAIDGQEPGSDVLNGIAYNPVTKKIYMTGKLWPKLYEVKFE